MSDMNEQEYMQSALESLDSGDYNAAQVFFKQAIRVNNTNEDAWLGLAKTYPTEPEKALKCYENVLKINPLNAEAQRMIDRLTPASAPSSSSSAYAAAAAGDDLRGSAAASAPKERKPLGGPAVNVPKGIEGAPESLNLDYLVDFFQRAFKGSAALLTGQGDGSAELATSWWNIGLMVVTVGIVTGLFGAIAGLRFGMILSIITLPLIKTVAVLIAFGGGAFLSHWYLKTYREGSASLLDHTMAYARVWFPASLIFALVTLVAGLSSNFVTALNTFLITFSLGSGLGLILLVVNAAVAVYAALLLQRQWARLYPNAVGTTLWIAVAIAFAVTSIVL